MRNVGYSPEAANWFETLRRRKHPVNLTNCLE
jgi:hypothetical protein